MTESEMRLKVVALLHAEGLEVCHESNKLNNCDLVGFEFEPRVGRSVPKVKRVWAIEMKVSYYLDVLGQAMRHQPRVNKSFAAMPSYVLEKARPQTIARFTEQGIGMIAVSEGAAWVAWDAVERSVPLRRYKKTFWRHHLHPQEHGRGSRGN